MARKKKAILVGISQFKSNNPNYGALMDIHSTKIMLRRLHRMREEDIVVMLDTIDDPDDRLYPTSNHVVDYVTKAFEEFEGEEFEGEVFLYFSCHGHRFEVGRLHNNSGHLEEVNLADFTTLSDDDLRELAKSAPTGVFLTISSDSCCSGALIEGAHEHIGNSTLYFHPMSREYFNLQVRLGGEEVGLLLSACQSKESAYQGVSYTGIGGVFTSVMNHVLFASAGNITNRDLVRAVNERMSTVAFDQDRDTGEFLYFVGDVQHAGLYGTQKQSDRLFLGGPVEVPAPARPPEVEDPWED